jgi:hypothetical protein
MNRKPGTGQKTRRCFMVLISLVVTMAVGALPVHAAKEDEKFVAVERDGSKVWEGGGTINLKGRSEPVTLKVVNKLNAEHGFAIDSMKVKEVLKPGEEKTITVPLENIDQSVPEHRVYCHLHPKHVAATLKVKK